MPIAQYAHKLFLCISFSFSGCYSSQKLSQNNILMTTIKFKTFQDYLRYFVKFNEFKALNLVQSNSRLSSTGLLPVSAGWPPGGHAGGSVQQVQRVADEATK